MSKVLKMTKIDYEKIVKMILKHQEDKYKVTNCIQ